MTKGTQNYDIHSFQATVYPIVSQLNKCQVNISFLLLILRQEASVKLIFQHSKKMETGPLGSTVQELFKFESRNLFGTPFRKDDCFKISDF